MPNMKRLIEFNVRNPRKILYEILVMGIPCIYIFCAVKAVTRFFDNDTFWIIATGRNILENMSLPTTNPFVIHEGLGMIVHQWLFDVWVAFLYDSVGQWSLIVFVFFCFFATFASSFSFAGCYTDDRLTQFSVCAYLSPVFLILMKLRPSCVTVFVILIFLTLLEKAVQSHSRIFLIILPLLSLLIANVHTSLWLLLPVFYLPFIAPDRWPKGLSFRDYWKDYFSRKKLLLFGFLLVCLGGLINPYGIKGALYPLLSYSVVTNGLVIQELQKPEFLSFGGLIILFHILLLCFYLYRFRRSPEQIEWRKVYLALGTIFLGLMHIRDIWMCYVGIVPLLTEAADRLVKRMKESVILDRSYKKSLIVWTAVLSLFFGVFSAYSNTLEETELLCGETPQIADYLDEHFDKEKDVLYAGFNNGGYMQFRGYKTFLDARPEIYSKKLNGSKDILSDYIKMDSIHVGELIEQYGFDYVIADNKMMYLYLALSDHYDLIMEDNDFYLFQKTGS